MKKFMNSEYGLLPEQVEHTFKSLRAQAANRPAPTVEEYEYFIERQKAKLARSHVDEKTQNSILKQLNKKLTVSELPDGATFYALKKLQARSRDQKVEFVQMIKEIAQHRGTNRNEALRAFKSAYEENENTYTSSFSDSFDAKSKAIYRKLLERTGTVSGDEGSVPQFSSEPRITRIPTNSTWALEAGYDPDDGRLEIATASGVYAYHNVPQQVWNEIEQGIQEGDYHTGSRLSAIIRDPAYKYDSREASERDAYGRYCEFCHKYKAISGHICDGSAEDRRASAEIEEEVSKAETVAEDKSELSYEAALARLTQEFKEPASTSEEEEEEETPRSPRRARRASTGPTARQRRWMRPLEERQIVDLNNSEFGPVDGSSSSRGWYKAKAPKAADIRRAVIANGDVATFSIENPRRGAYVDNPDTGRSEYVVGAVSQDVKAYIDDESGIIKFERVGNPKCDCDAYRVNGRCPHLYPNNEETTSAVFERDIKDSINTLHKTVDRSSFLRSNTPNDGTIKMDFDINRRRTTHAAGMECDATPSNTQLSALRRMLDDGREVRISLSNVRKERSWDHIGTAEATLYKEDGEYKVKDGTLTCWRCNRDHRTCPDSSEGVQNYALALVNGQLETNAYGTRRNTAAQENFAALSSEEVLSKLEKANKDAWINQDDANVMNVFASSSPAGVDHSYTANLDQYIADVREAEKKAKNGENPLPFVLENATGGVCAPETGRGFGLELEYVLPAGQNHAQVMGQIAKDLYDAGLSDIDYGTRYHGYSGNKWHIEADCTVAGEVVSPILYDSPENWEQLQKVCDIIKSHGGKASVATGQHVHMGLGGGSPAEVERRKVGVTQIYAAYEDTLRRVQANPERKKHRDSQWCSPMDDSTPQSNVYYIRNNRRLYPDHSVSLNLGHQGRVEFRGADGSLDPAHIQAQVTVAAGIVKAAERGEIQGDTIKHSKVGSNAHKMKLLTKGKRTKPQTDDELIVADVELRKFADDILGTDHGRKVMAGIAANTPWQETNRI